LSINVHSTKGLEMSQVVETDGHCVVCGAKIVKVITTEYDPSTGPRIFGPGGRRQYRDVFKGFHCSVCGLKYAFVPPKKDDGS